MSADTEETMRRVTGSRPIAARPLGGGRVADVRRIDLADGRSIVAKIGGARSRLAFEGFMLGFSAERSRLPVEALRADDALFGAFGMAFFASHRRHRPIRPGFFEARRDFYNLYPLLVHARLFGGPCLGRIECVLDRFGG